MELRSRKLDLVTKNAYFPCKFPVKQGKWVDTASV